MKTIMVVGAGLSQIPAINIAKVMGLKVLAIDGNPLAPGLKCANFSEIISTNDVKKAIEIAKKYEINGVLTIGTDSGVRTVAAVAHSMGLVGIQPKSAEMTTDKYLMRKRLFEENVPSPNFGLACDIVEGEEIANQIGFPLVIKPIDSSGSRGVKFVKNPEELMESFSFAQKYSPLGKVIIEEFMEGNEVSVEALTFNKNTTIVAITDKITSTPPYFVELGHTIPSSLSEYIQTEICNITKKSINALGIDMTGSHTEIKITNDGPKVVEVGARLGGWIAADMIPLVTGIDMVKQVINIAMGYEPVITTKLRKGAALRVLTAKNGTVLNINGLDEMKKADGVKIVEIFIKLGDNIKPLHSGFDRIGRVVTVGDNREEAVKRACVAEKLINIETK